MHVYFMSRSNMLDYVNNNLCLDNGVDIVSISDTHSEARTVSRQWRAANVHPVNAAVFLKFADVEEPSQGMTTEQATRIVNFVDVTVRKKKVLVVHCFAGISRSGAVAKFVNDYYLLGDAYLNDYVGYNLHVYHTLMEAASGLTLRSHYKALKQEPGNEN